MVWASSSPLTGTARHARRTSTRPMRSLSSASAIVPWRCSTGPRSGLCSHGLHLAQRRQAPEGFELDLPDPLAGETETAADLLECLGLRVVETVAQHEYLPLALLQREQGGSQRLRAERDLDRFFGKRIVAGDEIAEDGVFSLADRLVEGRGCTSSGPDLVRLLNWQARLLGDLLERRLAAELRPERALRAVHLLQALDDVHRHANRACLVGKRAGDRLPDPPGCVGRELVATPPVELLDGADQAQGSFLDQVEEWQELVAAILGVW